MGITEILRRINKPWNLKQPIVNNQLNSSLRHIIVTNVASQHYIHELASASVHTRFVAFGMVISKPKGITSFLTSYWSRKCHKRIRYARQICRAVGTGGQGDNSLPKILAIEIRNFLLWKVLNYYFHSIPPDF